MGRSIRISWSLLALVFLQYNPCVAAPQTKEVIALGVFVDALNVSSYLDRVKWSNDGLVSEIVISCGVWSWATNTDVKGTLPDPLGFEKLEMLSIQFCKNIRGTIDDHTLSTLTNLRIEQGSLSGQLNLGLLNASTLVHLTLGDLPAVRADISELSADLPVLRCLSLYTLSLVGEMKPTYYAPLLETLHLKMLRVSGTIPMLPLSHNLEKVHIERAQVHGFLDPLCAIPPDAPAIVYLVSLDIKGTFPECIRNLTSMEGLFLEHVGVTGAVPEFLWLDMPDLVQISLKSLSMHGEIPPQVCNFKNYFARFKSTFNQLSLNVSAMDWKMCKWLRTFFLQDTNAFGVFPELSFPLLEAFSVSGTAVSGQLPQMNWENATALYDLPRFSFDGFRSLSRSSGFNGTIPGGLFLSNFLEILSVDCSLPNSLRMERNMTLDEVLCNSYQWLTVEVLHCPGISGPISANQLGELRYLRLDGVDLGGAVPVEMLTRTRMLYEFSVPNCNISTPFPDNFHTFIASTQLTKFNMLGNPLPCPPPLGLWCLEYVVEPGGLQYPSCGEAPTVLNATSTGSTVEVFWLPPPLSSADGGVLVGQKVLRSTEYRHGATISCDEAVNVTVAVNQTSFTFRHLAAEFLYIIRIVGVYRWEDRVGDGITWFDADRQVAEVRASTTLGLPSAAPGNARIGNVTATSVQVLWTPLSEASDLDGFPVSYYFVRALSTNSNGTEEEIGSCSTNYSSCIVEGLDNSVKVTLSVVATVAIDRFASKWYLELEESPSSPNLSAITCRARERGGINSCFSCLGYHGCDGGTECVFPHSGPLCGHCRKGYFFESSSFECNKCPPFPWTAMLILPLLATAGWLLVRLRKRAIVAGMLLTAFINTAQLCGVCLRIVTQLPSTLSALGEGGGYFNLGLAQFHLDCYDFTSASFHFRYFLLVLVLPIFCCLIAVLYDRILVRQHTRAIRGVSDDVTLRALRKDFLDKRANQRRLLLFLATLYYVRFVSKLVEPFVSVESSSGSVLVADDTEPSDSTINVIAKATSAVLLSAAVALPVFIGVKLRRASKKQMLEDLEFYATFGALYSHLNAAQCHFESLVLLRKAIAVSIALALLLMPEWQLWLLLLAGSCYFLLLVKTTPFRESQRHFIRWTFDIVNFVEVVGAALIVLLVGVCLVVFYTEDPFGTLSVFLSATVLSFFLVWLAAIACVVFFELRRGFDDANLQVTGDELLPEVERLVVDIQRALAVEKYSIAIELKLQLDHLRRKGEKESKDLGKGHLVPVLTIPSHSAPIARLRVREMASVRGQLKDLVSQRLKGLDIDMPAQFSSILWSGWRGLCSLLETARMAEDIRETKKIAGLMKEYERICFEDLHRTMLGLLGTAKQDVMQSLFQPSTGWGPVLDRMNSLHRLAVGIHPIVGSFKSSLVQLQAGSAASADDDSLLSRLLARKPAFVRSRRLQELQIAVHPATVETWCLSMLSEATIYLSTAVKAVAKAPTADFTREVELQPLSGEDGLSVLPSAVMERLEALQMLSAPLNATVNPLWSGGKRQKFAPMGPALLKSFCEVSAAAQRRTLLLAKMKRGCLWTTVVLLIAGLAAGVAVQVFGENDAATVVPAPPIVPQNSSPNSTRNCEMIPADVSPICPFPYAFWGRGANMTVAEAADVVSDVTDNVLRFILSSSEENSACITEISDIICALSFQQCNGTCFSALPCRSICLDYLGRCANFLLQSQWKQLQPGGTYFAFFKARFPSERKRQLILWGVAGLGNCDDPDYWAQEGQCSNPMPQLFPSLGPPLGSGICEQRNDNRTAA